MVPSCPISISPAIRASALAAVAHSAKRRQAVPLKSRRHSSLAKVALTSPTPSAGAKKFKMCHKASMGLNWTPDSRSYGANMGENIQLPNNVQQAFTGWHRKSDTEIL